MSQCLAYLYMVCRSGVDTIVHAFQVFPPQEARFRFNRIKEWIKKWLQYKPEVCESINTRSPISTIIANMCSLFTQDKPILIRPLAEESNFKMLDIRRRLPHRPGHNNDNSNPSEAWSTAVSVRRF